MNARYLGNETRVCWDGERRMSGWVRYHACARVGGSESPFPRGRGITARVCARTCARINQRVGARV